MPAGRPKLSQKVIHLHIQMSLRAGEDDDLIAALGAIPARKRSSFVKSSLRSGGIHVNLGDLPDDDDLADSLMDNFLQ